MEKVFGRPERLSDVGKSGRRILGEVVSEGGPHIERV
jgi:hypothetical protein